MIQVFLMKVELFQADPTGIESPIMALIGSHVRPLC
jgi:hypothetical protein